MANINNEINTETYATIGDKFHFQFGDPIGSGNDRGPVYLHTITALAISGRYVTYHTDRGSQFTYEINERPCGLV